MLEMSDSNAPVCPHSQPFFDDVPMSIRCALAALERMKLYFLECLGYLLFRVLSFL